MAYVAEWHRRQRADALAGKPLPAGLVMRPKYILCASAIAQHHADASTEHSAEIDAEHITGFEEGSNHAEHSSEIDAEHGAEIDAGNNHAEQGAEHTADASAKSADANTGYSDEIDAEHDTEIEAEHSTEIDAETDADHSSSAEIDPDHNAESSHFRSRSARRGFFEQHRRTHGYMRCQCRAALFFVLLDDKARVKGVQCSNCKGIHCLELFDE